MFLHNLDEDEQKAFMGLAHNLSEVDGIKGEEKSLIAAFIQEMGAVDTHDDGHREGEIEELCGIFDSRKSKVSALLELVALGYVDDEFSASESDFVFDIAKRWEIDDDTIDDIENWVRRQYELIGEAQDFWNEGDDDE